MSRRIALVTDWFAPRRGGIESQLHELAGRLSASGDQVTVITSTPGEPMTTPFAVRRLDVVRLPSPPVAVSPRLPAALRGALTEGFDVVHAHVSVVSPVGWLGAMVARSLSLPTVVTFHSVLQTKALILRALGAVAPIASSRVTWTAVSDHVAAQARRALGDGTVSVLPNGIDLDFWRGGARSGRDEIVLVSAMRLHRKKRGVHLVRAFADAVRGLSSNVRLVIVGEGPEHTRILSESRRRGLLEGRHRVELRGWMSPGELRALYADADAFALASVHESFGIAALEARAAGLPVIARRSGSAEFLRHNGNALLADDDFALAENLRRFLESDSLRKQLTAAPTEVERYDWSAVLAAHRREYDRATALAAFPAAAVVPSG